MKRNGYLLSILVIVTLLISCNKSNDNLKIVTRKPYAWVAGDMDSTGFGMILFSADNGETWVRQGQGSASLKDIDVNDIWAVDENNVWAVCSGNVILKTSDGGRTWTRKQTPANKATTELSAISIVNKTNIWISGDGGTVYHSKDNGSTWTIFDTNIFHNGLMQGIWAISTQKIYVVGSYIPNKVRGFIGFTLDGGVTWDSISPVNNYNRYQWIGVVSFMNTIVVYGREAHYIQSTDAGATWKNDSIKKTGGVSGEDINHMIMLNSESYWGALDNEIFFTNSGGSTWVSQPSNSNYEFNQGIDAYDNKTALTVGSGLSWIRKGTIQKTINGGTTWKNVHTYHSYLRKVSFIKP